jgi:hypothetical protein
VFAYDLSGLLSEAFHLMVLKQFKTSGDAMANEVERRGTKNLKKLWLWPAGVANSLAGAAASAFSGCWHRKMSWPIEVQGYKYQVCLTCGVKRLFDEKTFSAYGPFRNDLDQLIAREGQGKERSRPANGPERPRL